MASSTEIVPLEIVELNSFRKDADELLSPVELEALRQELAVTRQMGTIIPGTGGIRKFRWGSKNKGKRGGVRVIYYYGGDNMPIFLIAIYAKNEKIDMSVVELRLASSLVEELREVYSFQIRN